MKNLLIPLFAIILLSSCSDKILNEIKTLDTKITDTQNKLSTIQDENNEVKNKLVDIETKISTTEIYRGEVTYVDSNNKKLIELFGTNQSLWSIDTFVVNDIVEVTTTDKLISHKVKLICRPEHGHCHFEGRGAHSLMHIREPPGRSMGSGESENLEYRGQEYVATNIKVDGIRTIYQAWVPSDFDFTKIDFYGIFLLDTSFNEQKIDNRVLLLDYTYTSHDGH